MPLPLRCLAYVLVGYLSGNIMYAYWLPRLLKGVDVRTYGADKNPGAANATVACGLPMGILCAVMDILKGTIPVALAFHISKLPLWYMLPVVIAPVAGHAWPILFHGKGGKAIATSFGVLIGLLPEFLLAPLWAVLLLTFLPFIHDHRELILATSTLLAVGSFVFYPMWPVRLMTCGVSGILMYKHRAVKVRTPETLAKEAAEKLPPVERL